MRTTARQICGVVTVIVAMQVSCSGPTATIFDDLRRVCMVPDDLINTLIITGEALREEGATRNDLLNALPPDCMADIDCLNCGAAVVDFIFDR